MLFAMAVRRRFRTLLPTRALLARLAVVSLVATTVMTGVAAPGPDATPPVGDETIGLGSVAAGWTGSVVPRHRGEMAGFTWSTPSSAALQVRGHSASGGWSEWLDLDGEPSEAPERAETATRVHFAGPAWLGHDLDRIDVRIVSGAIKGLQLHVIDTEPARSAPLGVQSATALPGAPGIITRAEWGADESWRSVNSGCGEPKYAKDLTYLVIHHTVNDNSYAPSDSAALVRGIYRFHVFTNGWCDIAYNFLVDRYGQIFEGRYGGIREAVIGGHAGGFNTNSTGIAMLGNFQTGTVPSATYNSLRRLVAFKLGFHGVDPLGTANVHTVAHSSSRFPPDQDIVVQTIVPHGDLSQTSCPGTYLRQLIPALRRDVANDIKAASTDRRVVGDWNGDGIDTVGNFDSGYWYLRNDNSRGGPDTVIHYGWPGVTPVVGDWNGDGIDTIGVFSGDTFYLRNSNTPGPPDLVVRYGWPAVTPVVGDWNGDGVDTIGVYYKGSWMLRDTNTGGPPQRWFDFGWDYPQPVVGDWNGDGVDGIGIYWDGHWNLRQVASPGSPDASFDFRSLPGQHPVAGHWRADSSGSSDPSTVTTVTAAAGLTHLPDYPGTYRGAWWFLGNSDPSGAADVSFWF